MRSLALFCALALIGCGDPVDADAGPDAAAPFDASGRDAGQGMDAGDFDAGDLDAGPPRDAGEVLPRGSVRFGVNAASDYEYGRQLAIPPGFGEGELTLELWIRPDDTFGVGSTAGGAGQRENWSDADERPYNDGDWWYAGNFLLDGHNNAGGFDQGTFSLQFYGGGRLRWMLGDGAVSESGGVWSAGAYPAASTASIVDDRWHHVATVRRWDAGTGAVLELWIDGAMVGSQAIGSRVDMRAYWDTWPGFGGDQDGWFWGAEKQAAVGALAQYEDYKGLLGELRFWSVARSADELGAGRFDEAVDGTEPGLVGWFPFDEGGGDMACDALDRARCMALVNTPAGFWSTDAPPLR